MTNSDKTCAYCKNFGHDGHSWCNLDYHGIFEPLKETCEEWEED